MVSGINTNYNNYSSAAQSRTQRADSVSNGENAQTLDDFKREMYNTLNRMPVHPSQSGTQISIDISDKADAMGSAYGATFTTAKSDSFLRKNTKKTSSDYDDYYSRSTRYRLTEKRLQEKRVADREIAEDLREQKLAQTRQLQEAALAYDNQQDYGEEVLHNGNYKG